MDPNIPVQVLLSGGPCDGQRINVWPKKTGLPYIIEALPPAEKWAGEYPDPEKDYHSYTRVGDGETSRKYEFAPHVPRPKRT